MLSALNMTYTLRCDALPNPRFVHVDDVRTCLSKRAPTAVPLQIPLEVMPIGNVIEQHNATRCLDRGLPRTDSEYSDPGLILPAEPFTGGKGGGTMGCPPALERQSAPEARLHPLPAELYRTL